MNKTNKQCIVKRSTNLDSTLISNVHNSIVVIHNMPVIADADVAALLELRPKG